MLRKRRNLTKAAGAIDCNSGMGGRINEKEENYGMVFTSLGDFLPAFADFSRASPYDFTHVALTLPLTAGGEVLGLLRTEHSGISFNPFVSAGHKDAERHYFGKDHLGSVRAVTNQWGSPLYMFDYDVFGNPLQDRPERFRHGFTGKEYDSWTGLYNYGFRDYTPLLGRFTSVDPVQDGHNWYAYVNSDPVNWLDPWGLEPCKQESGEDKKSPVATTNTNKKNKSEGWRAYIERQVKENSTTNLGNGTKDILVIIPEEANSYDTPESLIINGLLDPEEAHMDGLYNVTTGELIKVSNGYSVYVEYEGGEESASGTARVYRFTNSVKKNRPDLIFIANFGKNEIIREDELKDHPKEAAWLEQDLVKQAINQARGGLSQ